MKLHADRPAGNYIRSFEPGRLCVGERELDCAAIISAERLIEPWLVRDPQRLTLEDFQPALALDPELIVLGTGLRQAFPAPEITTQIMRMGIGLEIMATHAACRTYNVLLAEQRRVIAALLVR